MSTEHQRGRTDSEYQRHMRALEECATRLEGGGLDPQEALDTYREAQTHYEAVDRILAAVEDEISEIRGRNERSGS